MNFKRLLKVKDGASVYYALLEFNYAKYIVRIDDRYYDDNESEYQFDNGKDFTLGEDYKYYKTTPVFISNKKGGVWTDWEKADSRYTQIIRVHGNFSDFDDISTDVEYLKSKLYYSKDEKRHKEIEIEKQKRVKRKTENGFTTKTDVKVNFWKYLVLLKEGDFSINGEDRNRPNWFNIRDNGENDLCVYYGDDCYQFTFWINGKEMTVYDKATDTEMTEDEFFELLEDL